MFGDWVVVDLNVDCLIGGVSCQDAVRLNRGLLTLLNRDDLGGVKGFRGIFIDDFGDGASDSSIIEQIISRDRCGDDGLGFDDIDSWNAMRVNLDCFFRLISNILVEDVSGALLVLGDDGDCGCLAGWRNYV